jgi:serine/threonine protein phosphatase PrpC
MRITASTDVGLRSEQNQDCYKAGRLGDDSYWIVLCDGMGGVTSGGEASYVCVSYLSQAFSDTLIDLASPVEVQRFMLDAVVKCNEILYNLSSEDDGRIMMGTTVVMACIRNSFVQIVHAGDSRAYHISKRNMNQLTVDHSVVQELLDSGKITEQQAKSHPNKNIITRALGVEKKIVPDYNEIKLSKGDILLLCTDGLTNMVEDSEILSIIRSSEFFRSADNLVKRAVELGGMDNVTAVVFEQ